MRLSVIILFSVAMLTGSANGQPAPATSPATAPARFEMVMPAGYQKVTVGSHTAVCKAADIEWVKKGIAEMKPATRPSTMPVDILKRVTDARPAVVKQMVEDLALADDKGPNQLFDEKILATLKKMDEIKPPVFFLVITRQQLRDLSKEGWGEPRFHFNRTANEVSFADNVMLSIEKPMDDSVLPYFYEDKETPEVRAEHLGSGIQKLDSDLAKLISDQIEPSIFNFVAQYIGEKYIDIAKQPRDQQWLAMGVTGYFSTKYCGMLTPHPRELWLKMMIYEDARYPVSSKGIDLTKPLEPSAMKAVAVPYYDQAMRRKAVAVVGRWAEKSGDASVTKALVAAKAKPSADGVGLVKLIVETCGVDLAKELGPG